jgi:hypothetical protein
MFGNGKNNPQAFWCVKHVDCLVHSAKMSFVFVFRKMLFSKKNFGQEREESYMWHHLILINHNHSHVWLVDF